MHRNAIKLLIKWLYDDVDEVELTLLTNKTNQKPVYRTDLRRRERVVEVIVIY